MNVFARLLPLAVVLLPVPARGADVLRAGAAKIDITPPTGYALWGYIGR